MDNSNIDGRHKSRPYTPDIEDIFIRAGYVETWGRGIQKICEACKRHGILEPALEKRMLKILKDNPKMKRSENTKWLKIVEVNCFLAFLMPFDSADYEGDVNMIRIGQATSNWKDNGKDYQKIQGILLDVKKLMKISVGQEEREIQKLADLIERV